MSHLFTRKLTPARWRKMRGVLKAREENPPTVKIKGFKPIRPLPVIEAGSNRTASILFRRSPRFPKVRGAE